MCFRYIYTVRKIQIYLKSLNILTSHENILTESDTTLFFGWKYQELDPLASKQRVTLEQNHRQKITLAAKKHYAEI